MTLCIPFCRELGIQSYESCSYKRLNIERVTLVSEKRADTRWLFACQYMFQYNTARSNIKTEILLPAQPELLNLQVFIVLSFTLSLSLSLLRRAHGRDNAPFILYKPHVIIVTQRDTCSGTAAIYVSLRSTFRVDRAEDFVSHFVSWKISR